MGTAERIFDLVDAKYKEQRDFAKAIGVSASMVSQWRMGITKSYTRRLPQIAEVLGTTTEYLLTGSGPKERSAYAVPKWADVSNDQIKAAFFEGAKDLTQEEMDELWADAQDYMRYKLQQRRKQKE